MNRIKGFVNGIKEQYAAMEEVRRNIFRPVQIISVFELDSIKIKVLDDPTYLKAYGFKIAACVVTGPRSVCICVDDLFKSLDEKIKWAIVYHEIAHFINEDYKQNMHVKNIKRAFNILCNKCDARELKADAFAAEKTSKETMIETLNIVKGLFDNVSVLKEIDIRIEAMYKI